MWQTSSFQLYWIVFFLLNVAFGSSNTTLTIRLVVNKIRRLSRTSFCCKFSKFISVLTVDLLPKLVATVSKYVLISRQKYLLDYWICLYIHHLVCLVLCNPLCRTSLIIKTHVHILIYPDGVVQFHNLSYAAVQCSIICILVMFVGTYDFQIIFPGNATIQLSSVLLP